jgi:uncharacterized membrane protein
VCPLCDHALSHYRDAEMSRGDEVASRIATITGTWGFLALLLLVVGGWYAAELIWSPALDQPGALIRYLEIMLAFLAPLILLVQQRGENRDRARDWEMLRIVINTELDVHVVRDILERNSGATNHSLNHSTDSGRSTM